MVTDTKRTLCFPRQSNDFDTRLWFHLLLAATDTADYVWHCNRHTFCSWLAMAGVSLKSLQEFAGHKTLAMTARYSHLDMEHKQFEIERISDEPKLLQMPKKKA